MKTKAEKGDMIQITHAFDEPYSIGDILEVDMRPASWTESEEDNFLLTTEGYHVYDTEYKLFSSNHPSEEIALRQEITNCIHQKSRQELQELATYLGIR